MNSEYIVQSPNHQKKLRTLVAFMGRTATYEQAVRQSATWPLVVLGLPDSVKSRGQQDEALRSSYAVISERLQSLGGVDYIAAHPDTHEPIAFHLTGWHGAAPDQPNYHLWDVQLATQTETIRIRSDYLRDLWISIKDAPINGVR